MIAFEWLDAHYRVEQHHVALDEKALSLENRRLVIISDRLAAATHIVVLNLSENRFVDVPKAVLSLTNLQTLNVSLCLSLR
jgi:hypothetical protein